MTRTRIFFLSAMLTPMLALAHMASAADSQPVAAQGASKAANFEAHKAKVLERIGERLSEVQKRQQCVQAATTGEAMKACMPPKGEGKGRKDCKG